ncbi:hypothetical protein GC175_09380 [bacterium]|nr:hypothetical protein [bacterium]
MKLNIRHTAKQNRRDAGRFSHPFREGTLPSAMHNAALKWAVFVAGQLLAFSFAVGGMLYVFTDRTVQGLASLGLWLILRRLGDFDRMAEPVSSLATRPCAWPQHEDRSYQHWPNVSTVHPVDWAHPIDWARPVDWAIHQKRTMPELSYFVLVQNPIQNPVEPEVVEVAAEEKELPAVVTLHL